MTAPLILAIEDDPPIRRFLRTTLGVQGYELVEAPSAREGLVQATTRNPDVVLVDLGLPDGDGIEVIRRLREWSTVPIIVLSARQAENDKVQCLDAGADDYLTKPFGIGELLARIRVALRRRERGASPGTPVIAAGPISVDLDKHLVTVREEVVHLTPIEYKLLVALIRCAGKVMTHEQLLREVWGKDHPDEAHVRIYIHQLRRKIEQDPARPKHLLTEPGVGYRLRDE